MLILVLISRRFNSTHSRVYLPTHDFLGFELKHYLFQKYIINAFKRRVCRTIKVVIVVRMAPAPPSSPNGDHTVTG